MPLFSLLKLLTTSKTFRRSSALMIVMVIAGDHILKYVDKKHAEAIHQIDQGISAIQKTGDERHFATMQTLRDIQASVSTTEVRVWELYRQQARGPTAAIKMWSAGDAN